MLVLFLLLLEKLERMHLFAEKTVTMLALLKFYEASHRAKVLGHEILADEVRPKLLRQVL